MAKNRRQATATIPINGTTSDNVSVPPNTTLLGFFTPGALTGASFSFKVGATAEATPVPLKPANTLYSVAVAADGYYPVDTNHFQGAEYIQVVSNLAEAAARTITLVFGQIE